MNNLKAGDQITFKHPELDDDLLIWLKENPTKELIVSKIEEGMCWVNDYPYGIDLILVEPYNFMDERELKICMDFYLTMLPNETLEEAKKRFNQIIEQLETAPIQQESSYQVYDYIEQEI